MPYWISFKFSPDFIILSDSDVSDNSTDNSRRRYDAYNYNAINTLDAMPHLSGVCMYSPHASLKWHVVKSVVAQRAT